MAGRPAYGAKPGAAAQPPKRVDPKLKLYNMIRWLNYLFFPFVGVVIICIGTGWAFVIKDNNFIKPLLVMIGGALLTYVSIYYNKR
jgi:hypothetical protein